MSREQTPTPHIAAEYDDIARTVLVCGDPLRAKFIAEKYLDNARCYSEIRGMLGFTGIYKGKRVSVQGHGMGIPSIGIYSYELFNCYDVEKIIRVGTCGAYTTDVQLGDVLFAMGACTDSNFADKYKFPGTYAPIADFGLLRGAVEAAERLDIPYRVGNILSSDSFYDDPRQIEWARAGVMGVEMEASGLYLNAAMSGRKALTILSVTDHLATGERMSVEGRQTGLDQMIRIALEIV
ncbi:MAG: purine-nucleoside phosphorylase [Bacteroidaceae bacterium]|nr:purine-nucleoside phosphorylase [Bacteroidaceae bacterium]